MFTGIVQDIGTLTRAEPRGGDLRIEVRAPHLEPSRLAIGDSVCVAGVCLTVIHTAGSDFAADVSRETLSLTTLAALAVDARLNLEPALRAGDPLGGHLVSGHVDGLATLSALSRDARSTRMRFDAPAALARFLAAKGSITVDGVSLTINDVTGTGFGVNLVPHTLAATTLGALAIGDRVNVEVDQIARYVDRLLGRD